MSYMIVLSFQKLIVGAFSFLGFIAGLSFFYRGFRQLGRKRLIEDIPRSNIRSIAMGLVEVYGSTVPANGQTIISPLSGKECVYYRYEIEGYRRLGDKSHWETLDKGEHSIPFILQDETDSVLVDPSGATIEIPIDQEVNLSMDNLPERVLRLLASKKSHLVHTYDFSKKMKFREYFIEPGDRLYVLGTAADNPLIEEASSQSSSGDTIIHKEGNNIFYISDRPESEILEKMRLQTFLGIYGGAALSVISLIILAIVIATTLHRI